MKNSQNKTKVLPFDKDSKSDEPPLLLENFIGKKLHEESDDETHKIIQGEEIQEETSS